MTDLEKFMKERGIAFSKIYAASEARRKRPPYPPPDFTDEELAAMTELDDEAWAEQEKQENSL